MNEALHIIIAWGVPGWVLALIAIIAVINKWFWKKWLSAYAGETAKIAATNQNFTTALEQLQKTNWLKTYAEENAKIATINQNFTNALEQLKAATREVALIQNAISNQIWLDQWHLNQRRDIYVKMIEIVELWSLERGKIRYHPEASRDQESDVINKFRKARAVARLMLEPELIDNAIGRVVKDVRTVDPRTATDGDYEDSKKRLEQARDGIVAAGRRELRFGASSPYGIAPQLDSSKHGPTP